MSNGLLWDKTGMEAFEKSPQGDVGASIDVVKFDVTNVAQMYYRDNAIDADKLTEQVFCDFPNLTPPFKFNWLEFRIDHTMKDRILDSFYGGDYAHRNSLPIGMGAVLSSQIIDDPMKAQLSDPLRDALPMHFGEKARQKLISEMRYHRHIAAPPRWMLFFTFNLFWKNEDVSPAGVLACYLDAHGKYIPDTLLLAGLVDVGIPPILSLINIGRVAAPMYYALSLLHCRNIQTRNVHPNPKLSKAREKKGKSPLTVYKTLNIHPTLVVDSGQSCGNKEIELRQHIRRGHWKTYKEERPMFGRPGLHGLFWVEDTVVNPDNTYKVEKDYKMHSV